MATRPIASGTVSFGLVAIPVKLYSTNESSSSISLNFIHEKCGTRVKYQYYCPTDDELVTRDELVKGYEFAKDQYVLFTAEELKKMEMRATHAIEITEFVPLAQVDPIYFEKAYYLGPDQGGEKPYRLLAEAMQETGRAALAKYAARGKDYLVLVRPFKEGLILQQLRYNDEIRAFSEVPLGDAKIDKAEMKLAVKLVDQIATDTFRPDKYADKVKTEMMAAIQQKIEGQEMTIATPEEPKAQIIDLMEALKASLGESDSEPAATSSDKKASRAKAGKKTAKAAAKKKTTRKPPKRAPRKKTARKKRAVAASGKKRKTN
ncbi:MAG: Ku protein [Acidobacteriota bacterium]|jgi:DNA end-binding protein Ku